MFAAHKVELFVWRWYMTLTRLNSSFHSCSLISFSPASIAWSWSQLIKSVYILLIIFCLLFIYNWVSHLIDTMQYLNRCIWFISLNIKVSRCIYFPRNDSSLSFSLAVLHCVWVDGLYLLICGWIFMPCLKLSDCVSLCLKHAYARISAK